MREHPGESLSALIDGTLDAAGAAEVEAHLHACAACRTETDALRATLADLQTIVRPTMAETDRARLHAELSSARRTSTAPWTRIGAVAAALMLVAGGGLLLTRSNQNDGELHAGAPPTITEENYTEENVRVLFGESPPTLRSEADASAPTTDQGGGPAAEAAEAGILSDEAIPIPDIDHTAKIAECEATFLGGEDVIRLQRVAARYEGEPAYLLSYKLPKDAPTHLELWVLAIEDCGVRYFAEQKL